MEPNRYIHDSESKQIVRNYWVEYISNIKKGDDSPLKLITLPSSEMQELILYAKKGLIEAELDDNTGKLHIKSGDIYCFEKKQDRYFELLEKLVGGTTKMDDICSYIRLNRPRVLNNKKEIGLPADAINLDFEASLCSLKIPIEETISDIVACQAAHKKSFALFLTFPNTENTDTEEYKSDIMKILRNNLQDEKNETFKKKFEELVGNLDNFKYETGHLIAVVKNILRNTSAQMYECQSLDLIIYGDEEIKPGSKKRMISLLFRFDPVGNELPHTQIYYRDILLPFDGLKYL